MIKWIAAFLGYYLLRFPGALLGFFIGGAIFSLFYIMQISLVYYLTYSIFYTIIYSLLLIPTGNFALNYHNNIVSYLKQYRLFRIFSKRSDIINDLEIKRKDIIDFIYKAKKYSGEKNEN